MMRILRPGDPCPCCGQPIPNGLSKEKVLLLLSYIAEGISLMDTINALSEMLDLPSLGATEEKPEETVIRPQEAPAPPDVSGEKRAILQRLKDYRAACGMGSLEAVSVKTAHQKGKRLSTETLRDLCADRAPKMPIEDWRKIARALDALEQKG